MHLSPFPELVTAVSGHVFTSSKLLCLIEKSWHLAEKAYNCDYSAIFVPQFGLEPCVQIKRESCVNHEQCPLL